jgi:hypothetical protein
MAPYIDFLIREVFIDATLDGLLKEKYKIGMDYNTSHWSWNKDNFTHYIFISKKTPDIWVRDVFMHEIGHSLYTPKDWNDTIQKLDIGCYSWNVFEDIRIEYKMEQDKVYSFWEEDKPTDYYYSPRRKLSDNAYDVLLQCKFWYKYPEELELIETTKTSRFNRIKDYYFFKAQRVSTILEQRALIAEFTREFPESAVPTNVINYFTDVMDIPPECLEEEYTKHSVVSTDDCSKDAVKVNKDKVAVLANKLKKMFYGKTILDHSDIPSKKISIKKFIQKDFDRLYLSKQLMGEGGNSRICVLIDCSGSMTREPIENARLLVEVLSHLAKLKIVSGYVGFSNSINFHLRKLPVDDVGSIIRAEGDEGFRKNIDKLYEHARVSKHMFIFSDGNVVDGDVCPEHIAQLGLDPIGLYIGKKHHCKLNTWLNEVIVADDMETLISEIINKTRGGRK